jgi:lactate 2-monooxygenase
MYGDFQFEIYLNGLTDVVPTLPTDLTRLESLAKEKLSRSAYDYVAGSAGTPRAPTARPSAGGGSCRGCCAAPRPVT